MTLNFECQNEKQNKKTFGVKTKKNIFRKHEKTFEARF